MTNRLKNRCVIITGGATGMGLKMAEIFAQESARVVILDNNHQAGETAIKKLRLITDQVQFYSVDVTDPDHVEKAFSHSADFFNGAVHVLVNNAGVVTFGNLEEASLADWNITMDVNAKGTFLCTQAALPYLKKEGGSVINMGPVAALVGIPQMAAYCAAKAAVVGLTKQMAVAYASEKIRVNCLCPGTVADTGMGRIILGTDLSPEVLEKRLLKYPLGRFGQSEEIARAALFLASDEASFITGASLSVDGGMTAL